MKSPTTPVDENINKFALSAWYFTEFGVDSPI
jgi:hypothetical protein